MIYFSSSKDRSNVSFPRKRESIILQTWIPAFAGMTIFFFLALPAYAKDEAGIVKEPEELYNEGVGLYRERQYPKAADSFSNALVTKEPDLEAKANYNIANSKYKEAKALGPGKEGTAIRLYKEALDYYKRSMELDQADEDAKFNYEFVQKELKSLEAKQQKKEQQQQQKQEQKQDKQQGGQQNQQQQQQDQQQGQQSQAEKQQQEQERGQAQEEKQKQDQDAQDQKSREREEQKAKDQEKKDQAGQGAGAGKDEEEEGEAVEPQEGEAGGMSRQEAQILLDAYGQQEEGTLKLRKRKTEPDVLKDW